MDSKTQTGHGSLIIKALCLLQEDYMRMDDTPLPDTGKRLRNARLMLGLGQGALADACLISQATISKLEREKIKMKGFHALTLEAGAGISHRYLFYDEAPVIISKKAS